MQEWVVMVADVLVNYMQVSSVYIYIYLIPLFVFFFYLSQAGAQATKIVCSSSSCTRIMSSVVYMW